MAARSRDQQLTSDDDSIKDSPTTQLQQLVVPILQETLQELQQAATQTVRPLPEAKDQMLAPQ